MKRGLHKDRPPPLKIHKPPARTQSQQAQAPEPAPPPHQADFHHPHPPPPLHQPIHNRALYRPPVIIHTYSPEIIQTDSRNFMQLVQRLTGPGAVTPPPPKRARLASSSSSFSGLSDQPPSYLTAPTAPVAAGTSAPQRERPRPPPLPLPSPRARPPLPPPPSNPTPLTHHPLLSPSTFDFSPSVLPSPSSLTFDFSSLLSPAAMAAASGAATPTAGRAPVPTTPPVSLTAVLPSPGPLSSGFFNDLPVLSPAAYSWIDRNASSAEAILSFRGLPSPAGLPPRYPGHPLPASPVSSSPDSDVKPVLHHHH